MSIKLQDICVYGWEAAIRGMRNPMNSWGRSDSVFDGNECTIGDKDLELMKKLIKNGPVHSKFLRMITVTVDITAPLYWWKEFDTYKVGTVANSCSTMHKIAAKEFTLDDFSHEHLISFTNHNKDEHRVPSVLATESGAYSPYGILMMTIDMLNICRERYLSLKNSTGKNDFSAKDIWWQMIQLLPSSYNQKRTVQMNYEVLRNMLRWRSDHKLDEWREFCVFMRTHLPYASMLLVDKKEETK